jgi:ubiquinone/menaquinone biosynthesis C-methylase UbiE
MMTWIYNERKHCGVDYSDRNISKKYDERHQTFRNYKNEFDGLLDFLGLKNTQELTLIDLGCGTGATSLFAGDRFKKVYGVDVSESMITEAKRKLSDKNLKNIEFINAGFLSYDHKDPPVDVLITKAAFHHLPDFWKQIALWKMNKMIKTGGTLSISDVVFTLQASDFNEKINNWISGFEKIAGKEFKAEVETHIRDEHSTFKWVLDGMIQNAGFKIENYRSNDGFFLEYHCLKTREAIEQEPLVHRAPSGYSEASHKA